MSIPVSALVLVKNEALKIRSCLNSLRQLSEVVLWDTGSTDDTLAIARQFPNVVVYSKMWKGFAVSKQEALAQAKNPWILWLDADEALDLSAQKALAKFFSDSIPSPQSCGVWPRKTFFMGRWIRHGGWYPDAVVRLFHRSQAAFNERLVHEGLSFLTPPRQIPLDGHILHDSFHALNLYFAKMDRYGQLGAQEALRQGKSARVWDLCARPLFSLFRSYFLRGGFKDGVEGVILAFGTAFSVYVKYVYLFYFQRFAAAERLRPKESWEQKVDLAERSDS